MIDPLNIIWLRIIDCERKCKSNSTNVYKKFYKEGHKKELKLQATSYLIWIFYRPSVRPFSDPMLSVFHDELC